MSPERISEIERNARKSIKAGVRSSIDSHEVIELCERALLLPRVIDVVIETRAEIPASTIDRILDAVRNLR